MDNQVALDGDSQVDNQLGPEANYSRLHFNSHINHLHVISFHLTELVQSLC